MLPTGQADHQIPVTLPYTEFAPATEQAKK